MKSKFLTLVLLVSLALVQSCSKSSTSPTPSIVGTWKAISREYFNCPTATDNKVYTCGNYAYCTTYTFNSNKTFTYVSSADNSSLGGGTYVLSGGYFALTYSYLGVTSTLVLQATISGTNLVTVQTGDSNNCSYKDTYQKQ
jgi:hypothetical protein